MIVAYDYKRGEPREKYKKEKAAEINRGDCIDCFQCVKVCPTNIDIRNGTQMECVGCTACIDACNKIMDATGRPQGLIRYASENGIAEKKKLRYTGRMKFYTVLLVLLAGLLTTLLITRKDIDGTITRAAGLLYQERGIDSLSNLFNIEIQNKTINEIPVQLKLEGEMAGIGKIELVGKKSINVKKEGQGAGAFFIVLPRNVIKSRKVRLQVGLYEGDKKITVLKTNFMGPFGSF
jgi:cytochrome c oxidase accessory protein FixG